MNEFQNMYYQLKSMRFVNTFSNILSTDAIFMKISIGWSNAFGADPFPVSATEPLVMAIPPDFDLSAFSLAYTYRPIGNLVYGPNDVHNEANNRLNQ